MDSRHDDERITALIVRIADLEAGVSSIRARARQANEYAVLSRAALEAIEDEAAALLVKGAA